MKRAIAWCATVVATLVLVVTADATIPHSVAPPRQSAAVVTQPKQPYRVVRSWEGKVAVFLPSTSAPECVYDTAVRSLPAEEQQKLAVGVEVQDENGLRRLLEDYLS